MHTWHTSIAALTLFDALLLLCSAYSDMVSPTVWMVAPFLGLAFGLILLFSLLWLGFLLITRRWKLTGIMLLTLLLCSGRIWRYCPVHLSDPTPITNVMEVNGKEVPTPTEILKVLTFNTESLGHAWVHRIDSPIHILDWVKVQNADLVCLQEYHFAPKKGHTEQELRDRLKKEYPYYHLLHNSNSKNVGIALYSKWPIVKSEKIDPEEKNYCWTFYCELDIRGRKVGLVNCHLRNNSISKENRHLYREQVSTHFQTDSLGRMEEGLRQLAPSFRERTKQVALIHRYLTDKVLKKGQVDMPLLVCGDMNDTPISFTYKTLRSNQLYDTWEDVGSGLGITYRTAPFWFRIDHIFHSKHFRPLHIEVAKEMKLSDHYPLVATFQLLPAEE